MEIAKNAWVTVPIFEQWFLNSFIPEVKQFLSEMNLSFKVLLLLDNVGSHSVTIQTLVPNVTVEFLPANTTSLIQPMDQSVISTFKANYLKLVMQSMLRNINQQCQNKESTFKVKQFWKSFTILDSIGFVDQAWNAIEKLTLNKCWKKLMPDINTLLF